MEKLNRSSGILLHVSSLPNDLGLGCFSDECYKFVDFLKQGGFKCWQVLPFTDCGYGKSPYSAFSSFAINPYFLDLKKYLSDEEIATFGFDKQNPDKFEEGKKHDNALSLIYTKHRGEYDTLEFEESQKYWLEDYAIYKVLKEKFDDAKWVDFPIQYKNRQKSAMDKFKLDYEKEIDKIKFIQFLLSKDWKELKAYANSNGIEIFGDIPMYLELDSADVWAKRENWQLVEGKPKKVSGVPPDGFNAEGQLWNQPIYDYEYMKKNKYEFWLKRMARMSEIFDIVRIDHFIAFSRYWAIPAGSKSAKTGKWIKGVGEELLSLITRKCKAKFVAEDLGIVTDDVKVLREKFDIAGIKVMQFAFDEVGDNEYQPHNYEKNCVAYIGTHDNNTFMGMLNQGDWDKINRFKDYLNMPVSESNEKVVDNTILALYKSSANLIIITAQDILKLGEDSRMNLPGVENDKNWTWQLDRSLDDSMCQGFKNLSRLYVR